MKRNVAVTSVVVGLVGLVALNLSKMQLSVQVRSVAHEVESSPILARELGAPVHVDVWATDSLQRYTLRHRDVEVMSLRTNVVGSRRRAELVMSVQNVSDQGWAGTYEVRTLDEPRLVNGRYESEPVRSLGQGTFASDGRALPVLPPGGDVNAAATQ